ncbi:MAG: alpha-glucosidase/alpha-galactosidase [Anaerolineae bacterium]|nr:alpha-glucosidase/alpha-galactosidase [Anaerolineae bacterium]
MTKIVIIGAGSTSFGPSILGDLFLHAHLLLLQHSEIWLVDTNAESLDLVARYAERLLQSETEKGRLAAGQISIHARQDRREALPNADFVIVSVAVDRIATWKLDWQIPLKHGVRHVLGENGGPGGLSHALRNIPLLLGIAHDIERLAPRALLINFTNPMSRLCLALHQHSNVKFVGLCHQIGAGYRLVDQVLGEDLRSKSQELRAKNQEPRTKNQASSTQHVSSDSPFDRYHLVAAGLNHFTFILGMYDQQTGEDLYPLFRQRVQHMPPYWELMSRRLMDAFGLFCATGDGHAGEYVGFAAETMPMKGYDYDAYERRSQAQTDALRTIVNDPTAEITLTPSGERAAPIISAILRDLNQPELAVNLPNRGCIENLPSEAIVEVPGLVNARGVRGVQVGPLPRGLAALMQREYDIQALCVEAAVRGDRQVALQALLLDPHIHSYAKANYLLDDLLRAHAKYLPQFGG